MASAETLPTKGKIRSHIHSPVDLEDGHFSAFKQPSLVSIRSGSEERDYECRNRSTTLDYGHGLSASHRYRLGGAGDRGEAAAAAGGRRKVTDYSFDDCRQRDHHSYKSLLVPQPLDRVSVHVKEGFSSGDWTNGAAHKRSHSEDRLKEG